MGGGDDDRTGHGQQGQADLGRGIAEGTLQESGQDQVLDEHAHADEGQGEAGAETVAVLEDVRRQERAGRPGLPPGEEQEQGESAHEEDHDQKVGPAVRLGLVEAVDDRGKPGGAEQ